MSNPIQNAISDIRFKIPIEILNFTYLSKTLGMFNNTAYSLDERIRDEVITYKVMRDANLIGGTVINIPIHMHLQERVDMNKAVYYIPKEYTNGRRITTALSVAYYAGLPSVQNALTSQQNLLMGMVSGILDSNVPVPQVSTARCQLIAENTVYVEDSFRIPDMVFLRAWIENPSDMSHLKLPSYRNFSRLCLYATRADIYNKNVIKMGEAYLDGGSEISQYRSIIEQYSDSIDMYEDYFDQVWGKISRFSDRESQRRAIRMGISGRT
jgi:hypothetical protein